MEHIENNGFVGESVPTDGLPRLEGEDFFVYCNRFADWLQAREFSPDAQLERDALIAIARGNYHESDRLTQILQRKQMANLTVIK